ncbi:hypothetical protein [Peribacillus frigoritolerans]|uniref:hypothetical protein n=1 Tax=Peribacillus castrilensis TaxID=2897690 RepID=UPI002DC2D120|nr:hypothetical protein [Peribacillus castrilensis]
MSFYFYTNLYSPFISSDKTADFNISLWAGLISGLFTGIFTGLLVGFILWLFQSKQQEKEERLKCEREISIFLQKLKNILETSKVFTLSSQPEEFLPSTY